MHLRIRVAVVEVVSAVVVGAWTGMMGGAIAHSIHLPLIAGMAATAAVLVLTWGSVNGFVYRKEDR
jgi:hypothetical protein